MKKMINCFVLFILIACLSGCGASSSSWSEEAQPGKYVMSEKKEYPYMTVGRWERTNESGQTYYWINVVVNDYQEMNDENVVQLEDGSYVLTVDGWKYVVRFNGAGKAKVLLEKGDDHNAIDNIRKSIYKKGDGTYNCIEPYDSSLEEQIEDAYNAIMQQGN